MTKRQRRQYEMFARVQQFGSTPRHRIPEGSTGSEALAAVAAAAQIEASASSKVNATRSAATTTDTGATTETLRRAS